MWQQQAVAATDTYKEFLTSIVACATSDHVATAVINAAGAGYAIGDLLEIRHASAEGDENHYCQLEVLTVSAGAILTVRINNGGAYKERAASAVVGAATGSGYAVGDILEVQDGVGASTEKAKFKVATLSGSSVATVTAFETGGAYTTTPTTDEAATIGIGPTAFAGDNAATLDLTMQSIIGTTGVASTAITGGGDDNATFDITLVFSGWAAQYNRNELTVDGVTDQKEVILLGTVVGGDAPYIGFFTYRADSGGQKRYGLACFGMTAFNSALAPASQPGIGPLAWVQGSTTGSHLLVAEEVAENNIFGISVSLRRICGFIRGNISTEADSYHTFYCGLLNGFGPQTTTPYPMFIGASSNESNRRTSDSDSTGLAEAFQSPSGGGPLYFMQRSDLVWVTCRNAVTPSSVQRLYIMWPMGAMLETTGGDFIVEDDNYKMFNDGTIGSNIRANVSGKVYPTPGTTKVFTPLPLTVASTGGSSAQTINTTIVGELDGCFQPPGVNGSGTVHTPEDILEDGTDRYILVPNSTASLANRPYQFFCFRQD